MWPASSNKSLMAIRVVTGIITGASLAFFVLILFKIFDDSFPAIKPGLSALPASALIISILFNILAIVLTLFTPLSKAYHLTGDLFICTLLVTLGPIGIAHDDKEYLSNGMWQMYSEESWMKQEWAAGLLMACSLILQLLLAFLSFLAMRREKAARLETREYLEDQPPKYYERSLSSSLKNVLSDEDKMHAEVVEKPFVPVMEGQVQVVVQKK